MSQVYAPAKPVRSQSSWVPVKDVKAETADDSMESETLNQNNFEESRDKLLVAIDDTARLLASLRDFNTNTRPMHYAPASASTTRAPLVRAHTTQPTKQITSSTPLDDAADESKSELSVLQLDVRVGQDALALVQSLQHDSVAKLLDGRMEKAERHLAKLRERLTNKQSKVLVTGDLNAGKSTLVNALLGREVMPVDQQPCTTGFCEVVDAGEQGVEEVHVVLGDDYDAQDSQTFERHSLDELDAIVSEGNTGMLKCYLRDERGAGDSLLKSGVVDIALIDGPGLNRDSVQTTAVLARQEEIDVVVFVVSAENHFTLSGKEFLWDAAHDKAYVFVVVNKFGGIRDQARCKRVVLEQIRQLSPATYEDADNLVHFVDAEKALEATGAQAFARLEVALRDFVLLKRWRSKLLPASTYMGRLRGDITSLARLNLAVIEEELRVAKAELEVARPALEAGIASQAGIEGAVVGEEEKVVGAVVAQAKQKLEAVLELVGEGQCAAMPVYHGLWDAWNYAAEVRLALVRSIEAGMRSVEDSTRLQAAAAVARVQDVSGGKKRVFNSSAMFATRRGLGTAILEVRGTDLLDAFHLVKVVGDGSKSVEKSLVPSLSMGLGVVTLGRAVGVRNAVEVVLRLGAGRWAVPVVVAATAGLVGYFVWDLHLSIPRNIGRSLCAELAALPSAQATRMGNESRKVVRLAGWDAVEVARSDVQALRSNITALDRAVLECEEATRFYSAIL